MRSKLPVSNGSGLARSATTKSALSPTELRAMSSIAGLTSIAVTVAPWLTSHVVSMPDPQPTSSTRQPATFPRRPIVAGRS